MLSYRHAFHAGNHADVLKHYVLSAVLRYFNLKDKPYWVIDTHAGAGIYSLKSKSSQKNTEFETGINRLLNQENLPESLQAYVDCIRSFNIHNQLALYPGSPKISQYYLRDNDKLRLFELHPNDYKHLNENFEGQNRQTRIQLQDGFTGIKALLPPPIKRAIVLIDPPYEVKADYEQVVECIKYSLKRFETGTYLMWYPLLQRNEPLEMVRKLKELSAKNHLDIKLSVEKPSSDGYGMHGSGLFIINPPWTLENTLQGAMPTITNALAQDDQANYQIEAVSS